MKSISTFAIACFLLGFEEAVSVKCEEWCNETPIPATDSDPGATQYCQFTGFCDGCDACSDEMFLACGSSAGKCKGDPFKKAEKNTNHEVRCCSDSPQPGFTKKQQKCPDVWGSSLKNNCVHAETYYEAKSTCENAGGRLCTAEELGKDCTRGTGCNHDNDHIWTSVPVVFGLERTLGCGKKGLCGSSNTKETYALDHNEVRCCSETAKTGWKKYAQCSVWGGSNVPTCFHAETYDSAVKICADVGARLCTLKEVSDGCTAGSGCGHDADFVWSLN